MSTSPDLSKIGMGSTWRVLPPMRKMAEQPRLRETRGDVGHSSDLSMWAISVSWKYMSGLMFERREKRLFLDKN